jgi:hypothetical protein
VGYARSAPGPRQALRPDESADEGDMTMRFIKLVEASEDWEAGVVPGKEVAASMGRCDEETAEGGGTRTVTDGPFAETKELFAGVADPGEVEGGGDGTGLARPLLGRRGGRGSPGVRGAGIPARDPSRRGAAREQARREESWVADR